MLAHRLSQDEIKEICVLAHGKHNDHLKEQLYQLTLDDDRRVAVNALWALTHFASSDHEWLYAKRHHLIDRCIVEQDATKLRSLYIERRYFLFVTYLIISRYRKAQT